MEGEIMEKIFRWLLIFFLLAGLYFSARIFWSWHYGGGSDDDIKINFSIEKGMTATQVVDQLFLEGIIADRLAFLAYLFFYGGGEKIQAGEYLIAKNLSISEVADLLKSGDVNELNITIPEGYTIRQIDELLARKGLINPGEFSTFMATTDLIAVKNLEGYLFPDTYQVVRKPFSMASLTQQMYQNFEKKISALKNDIEKSPYSLDEIIKVASLTEREAFGNDYKEKQRISGIIWKRLSQGEVLAIDATTRYEKNDWENPLTVEDFDRATPYNTRRKKGLPPTAISNPGLESIKAAIYPIDTDFYYYLHDKRGRVHFSKTLSEHNEKKCRVLGNCK